MIAKCHLFQNVFGKIIPMKKNDNILKTVLAFVITDGKFCPNKENNILALIVFCVSITTKHYCIF